MCNWASKQFDSQNLLFSMPANPLYQRLGITANEIQRGEIVSVDDETLWIKDIYRLQFNQQGIKQPSDISLVVQLMEQKSPQGAFPDGRAEYQPFAYGIVRLNNQDGTIRYGMQDVPLFKPPINLQKMNPSDLLKQVVKLTVGLPIQSSLPGQRLPVTQNTQQQQQPVN